ncbi:endonuclease III, putative [Entamoeba invadens IP1]|uniref:Endonuclease III, putative n=1 Tax=Entamoeba invadens IP1 TaxID=370355 RepID=A0A0A1TWY0_ENTIV|nr:endonuclease III, putative [Entamoeba invadens IP1]ELP85795.1 endonuclease III, putative [Entamoeba invadens IP1]|eukprot:XP_004185141.1 endonuclease III, putative [Entamoeba invadens IP1]
MEEETSERLKTLQLIEEYIAKKNKEDIPVNSMGAEAIAGMTQNASNKPFYTFLGTFLSPQTHDEKTFEAVKTLHTTFGELTPEIINHTSLETLQKCIKMVGFAKTKSKRLKECCKIFIEKYDGKVPSTFDELCALPGVGTKIASLILAIAFDCHVAIPVDTHVFTISNRLEWADATTPESTRIQLEEWLPKDKWSTFNKVLVSFGQCCCTKKSPKCSECPLQQARRCPYYLHTLQK